MLTRTTAVLAVFLLSLSVAPAASQPSSAVTEGDFIVRDFTFASGDVLPEVTIHYRTIGTPRKGADGAW